MRPGVLLRRAPLRPSCSNMRVSSSNSGLAVVSSLSPVKMLLAPHMNMTLCSSWLKDMRPAERRTWGEGEGQGEGQG